MMHLPIQNIDPFDFQGRQIRELTPAGLESVSVAEIEVARGANHPRERSTKSDKLYIRAQGTVSFWVEGQVAEQTIQLAHRDLLYIQKNRWFEYHNDSDQIVRLTLIHVPPIDLEAEEFLT